MSLLIEIDDKSGFCFGVVNAIERAEQELQADNSELFSLGAIVHNQNEVNRLSDSGLITINYDQFNELKSQRVFFRAHGEPPHIYQKAREHNLEIVDATCPVVLKLQQRIRKAYEESLTTGAQIVIFGKKGHAEVNGLVGQTDGNAIVVQHQDELNLIDYSKDIYIFAQTTMDTEAYMNIINHISHCITPQVDFRYSNTICKQMSGRVPHIIDFAKSHDRIFFIAGEQSSNGKVLYNHCLSSNPSTYFISDISELSIDMIPHADESIGICGATSTSRRQMEQLAEAIKNIYEQSRVR